jgi:predicted nucleotidyltransferase
MRKSPAKPKDIGASLFGKGRRKVLGVLFSRAEQPMYLREIIAAVGGGQGQVQRELAQLHRAGLVLREKRANLVYYRPNPDAPIYDELKAITFKTFGVADVLRDLLKPLSKRIAVAFIYGSVARLEDTARSDIDVMVVGDIKFSAVVLALSGAQERLRREVNPSVYSKVELRAKLKEKGGFLDRVMAGTKLFLIGNDDDLGQLVENRKAKASPADAR